MHKDTHTHSHTHTHSQRHTHPVIVECPKGVFCAEATVQLGLACLRAARLETEGDILPSGSMSMSVCVSVELSQRQVRV